MPSQPLSSFSSSLPSPLCLPLTKFSYATVSNEHIVPIPWIHLSSKNSLFAVFETSPTHLENGHVEDRQKLKVLRDPEVMEEIDLFLLSKEAHRSMNHPPTSLLDAQVPHVTIIVKVPNIAIKYPMTNGQIRRFQMRFASNEHYYDAMKVLARADVPTVEAGSFPATKPQPVQHPPPTNILPDDSASQIGGLSCGSQPYAPKAHPGSDHNSAPHPFLISAPTATATATTHNMLPPTFRSIDQSVGQLPTMQTSNNHISGTRSNISLTTGTTLVPSINALNHRYEGTRGYIAIAPHTETSNIASAQVGSNRYEALDSNPTDWTDQSAGLLLPPRRELPFSKAKPAAEIKSPLEEIATATGVAGLITNNPKDSPADHNKTDGQEQDRPPSMPTGKAKRAATKAANKTPAAKKPRVATTRKKPAAKKPPKIETSIPSVDELLQRPELGRMTRSRSVLATQYQAPMQNNNQQSKEPAEDAVGGKTPSRDRTTQDASSASRHGVGPPLEIREAAPEPDRKFPCTPADQIIQTHTPRPPTATDDPLSTSKQVHRQEGQSQRDPVSYFSLVSRGSSASRAPAVVQRPDDTENVIAKDSPFTKSEASLQAWATLPFEVRNPALRDFVCHSIMQPDFVDLCKALESIWETTLLEPRLRSRDYREM